VDELAVVELPVSGEDQEVSVKTEKVRLLSLSVHKKDTLRIKDDFTLASNRPNLENLLWYMDEQRNLDLRPGENNLR
ncbi:peptidoglycan-binding protein LysM, partial [Blautia wexlerae]|nr:peptidoglycan-binding protein LysM [Blautia wexlerae]